MCGGEARAGGGRGRLRRAGPENPKKAAAARALGPAGSCRGHLQRGRAAGDRRGNKSPPPRSRRAASGAYPAPRAQSVPASGPPQGAVGARAAGGPSPHVAHAQLSGEGGPETPGLASVAPEVAGFFPPPPKKAFLCVWEETAPACRSSTMHSWPHSLYPFPLLGRLPWCCSHHVLGQGLVPGLCCHCWLPTRPRGSQKIEQRDQRTSGRLMSRENFSG